MRIRVAFAIVAAVAILHGYEAKAEGVYTPPAVKEAVEPAKKRSWEGAYVEGGFGFSAGTLDASEDGEGFTLGDSSLVGHVGVGYDLAIRGTHVVVGVLGRYELSDVSYKAFGETLADAKSSWLLGGRVGWAPGPWMAYVLAGYRWSKLDPHPEFDIGDIDTSSVVLGGGLEVLLGNGVFAGLEYTASLEAGESFEDISIDSAEHAGKLRVGFKF